ncbi:DUF1062 domain-containing protein [Micromonospora zamorensis]|uniref:DUF1062 domain-containing protein n=1 Tax=Micromonospora zamorensis TaxID=709883 RepID=UPI0033A25E5C
MKTGSSHPRVNANYKLLDVWLLMCCYLCGHTSKIPVHETTTTPPADPRSESHRSDLHAKADL